MSIGESMFSAGFIQKTIKGDLFVKGNYGIPPRKQRGKILEESRRLSTKVDPEGCHVGPTSPTCRPISLWVPLVSLRFKSRFPTAIEIQSSSLIQVGLIRGLRIEAPAYIYQPLPPPSADPKTLIHILHVRIRASYQEKISPP